MDESPPSRIRAVSRSRSDLCNRTALMAVLVYTYAHEHLCLRDHMYANGGSWRIHSFVLNNNQKRLPVSISSPGFFDRPVIPEQTFEVLVDTKSRRTNINLIDKKKRKSLSMCNVCSSDRNRRLTRNGGRRLCRDRRRYELWKKLRRFIFNYDWSIDTVIKHTVIIRYRARVICRAAIKWRKN